MLSIIRTLHRNKIGATFRTVDGRQYEGSVESVPYGFSQEREMVIILRMQGEDGDEFAYIQSDSIIAILPDQDLPDDSDGELDENGDPVK